MKWPSRHTDPWAGSPAALAAPFVVLAACRRRDRTESRELEPQVAYDPDGCSGLRGQARGAPSWRGSRFRAPWDEIDCLPKEQPVVNATNVLGRVKRSTPEGSNQCQVFSGQIMINPHAVVGANAATTHL